MRSTAGACPLVVFIQWLHYLQHNSKGRGEEVSVPLKDTSAENVTQARTWTSLLKERLSFLIIPPAHL